MSKSNKAQISAPATGNSVVDQLSAIEAELTSVRSLTRKDRKRLQSRSASVPDSVIEEMIRIAESNGGLVAGMPLDVAAVQAALTEVSDARKAAESSRRIAQKMGDDLVNKRVVVADRIFAIHSALRRLVNTPEGDTLQREREQMAALVKTKRKKVSPPVQQPAAAPPAVVEPAPVAAAPAPSPAPAAVVAGSHS